MQQFGELARAIVHEDEPEWPTLIEIVAFWSKDGTRKGKRRSIEIPADQFFGKGSYGAPMSGDQLIHAVQRLAKMDLK